MNFDQAVQHFKDKYGNHTQAAKAIGWDARKYRDVRNGRSGNSDASRLLIALAEIDNQPKQDESHDRPQA